MAGSLTTQMFDRTLKALKGWQSPYALDIDFKIHSSVNIGSAGLPVQKGMVMSLTSVTAGAGNYHSTGVHGTLPTLFCKMGAKTKDMPIFCLNGQEDPSVSNPGVPAGVALGG